jgi:hypothetical protein
VQLALCTEASGLHQRRGASRISPLRCAHPDVALALQISGREGEMFMRNHSNQPRIAAFVVTLLAVLTLATACVTSGRAGSQPGDSSQDSSQNIDHRSSDRR